MEIKLTDALNNLVFFVLVLVTKTSGRSSGPPVKDYFSLVCEQMTPSPTAHGAPRPGDGGYRISIDPPMEKTPDGFIYSPGKPYSLTLVGTMDTFKGFLIQARDPATPPPSTPVLLGHFITGSDGEQTLDCDPMGVLHEATIGHSNANVRSSVKFTWKSPTTEGKVDFFYTVMMVKSTHFDRLSSFKLGPPSRLDLPNIEVAGPPGNALPSVKSPEEYRLKFRTPNGCNRTDCTVYIAVDTNRGNDSYIDIYMEGHAAGWVGIGFTKSSSMFSADVVACNRLNDNIECLDLWNTDDQPRGCPTDAIQDVYLFEGNYTNGRLSCKTAHFVIGVGVMAFHMINPIIALFRCKPKSTSRWLFNLLHGSLIGFTTELFALINIGIGLSIFDTELTLLWVYLSWDVVYTVTIVVLFALFAFLACSSTEKERKFLAPSPIQNLIKNPTLNMETSTKCKWTASSGVKVIDESDTEKKSLLSTKEKQLPSKDAWLRWIGLIVFLALSVPLSIAVIVLIFTTSYTSTQ